MTWREFQLRRLGFFRLQKEEWKKVRMVAFHAIAGTGALKKGTTLEKFMPLDSATQSKGRMSDAMKEAYAKAQETYKKQVNGSGT